MKLLDLLRRRRQAPARPNWRTTKRMCAIIQALVQVEEDEHTVYEIAAMTQQSVHGAHVALTWMETLELARSYFEEPAIPGGERRRLYHLTKAAYTWATQALLDHRAPDPDPTPQ